MPVPSQSLILLLPFVAATLAGWLSHDDFPDWANAALAGVAVVVCSTIWALTSQPMAGSLIADIVIIAAYCGWAIAGPLAPLQQYLTKVLPSPLAWLTPVRPGPISAISRQSMVSSAISPVPLRASALAPGQTWTQSGTETTPVPAVKDQPEQTPPSSPSTAS